MAVSITIDVKQNSQNIANNTSNVTIKVNAKWTNGSYNLLEKSGYLTIDGTKYTFTSPFNTGRTSSGVCNLFTKTLNITHSADGTKSIVLKASYTSGVSSGTVAAGVTVPLTTIPRKSTLSASNGTLGTAQTLTINRASTAFTHTITYKCGSASGTIMTKATGGSKSWTPPLDLAKQNTTGTSVSITFTITTYSGSTSLGSNTKTISCSIPASVMPSVSLTVSDPTGTQGTYGTYGNYVQGLSKFKITVSASGSQGSTIVSRSTSVLGKKYTASTISTETITSSGNIAIETTVTDSRGRTNKATKTISVLAYAAPKISSMSVKRGSGGDSYTVTFAATASSIGGKNTITYTVKYKRISDASYTTKVLTGYANKTSVSSSFVISGVDSSSYNIILTVTDSANPNNPATRMITGSSANKLFSIFKKGTGWAFGKIAELANTVDFGWKAIFREDAYFGPNKHIYGETQTGKAKEVMNPCNVNDNLVIGYGNYTEKDGQTNIYGHDINIGVSNIPTPGTHRPYRRKGDTITLTLRTAGYVTNAGKDVSFWIPMAIPIIGSPTATVTSGTGFVLRQGTKYTHGSAAEVYVTPSSYEVTATYANGIYVKAVFSNDTNVTNNDTIGIYWNGTITLS